MEIFDQRANNFSITGQVLCNLIIPMKLRDLDSTCEFFQTELIDFCFDKSQ